MGVILAKLEPVGQAASARIDRIELRATLSLELSISTLIQNRIRRSKFLELGYRLERLGRGIGNRSDEEAASLMRDLHLIAPEIAEEGTA